MDLFPLTSKTGTLWIVTGVALVSVRPCHIVIILIFYNIGRSSHLQTNRDISIYLALHFALGYSSMSNNTVSSPC